MRKIKIVGCGKAHGEKIVRFDDQVRYRLKEGQNLLDIIEPAVQDALKMAGMTLADIDCIVGGMATPLQPLPCNASLILERISGNAYNIPTMDINTSCTSFVTALDVMASMIDTGRYHTVLLVSGDTASAALNPNQKESYELFSDAATAFIITGCEEGEESGVLYAKQMTWPAGVHDTEIRGGGALLTAFHYNEDTKEDYYFDMKGKKVLGLSAKILPEYGEQCARESGIPFEELDHIFPHQASKALRLIMPRMGFKPGSYVDKVSQYGNMISAAIPYIFCEAIENGEVHRGEKVLLVGTAAGLTVNYLVLQY